MTHAPAVAEERGELTVAEQAVRRLAAHAVLEVDGVGGAAGRVLGVSLGAEDLDRPAKVDAHIRSGVVDLDVRISLTFPASVAATTERARDHLIDRVGQLTGMPVRRVDITVTALHTTVTAGRRVE